MRLSILLDHRFVRSADGSTWTNTCFSYTHWRRYLAVFEEVQVVGRAIQLNGSPSRGQRADGDGVTFIALPNYVGPIQYCFKVLSVEHAVSRAVRPSDAVILRVPSQVTAGQCARMLIAGRPYGVEVVGDQYEVFAPGAVRHPLRPLFRHVLSHVQQWQCANAAAAAYVTKSALQRRYPHSRTAFCAPYSDVEMPSEAILSAPRRIEADKKEFTILCVGSLAQMYKAPDVLIEAFAGCVRSGLHVSLVIVGDGKHRDEMQRLADALGIGERVRFLGELPAGDAVRSQMDAADLFVLPSRTEGLPRALIEAMARGLPCIGTTVGGIPELLAEEDMVAPGVARLLTAKIREVLTGPARMSRMSARNLRTAEDYRDDKQDAVRLAFYRSVRQATEDWVRRERICVSYKQTA